MLKKIIQLSHTIKPSASAFILILLSNTVMAAPGDILFSDNFERTTLAPNWTTDVGTAAGINTDTASSPTRSMFTRHQAVIVTSSIINLSVVGADLSFWVRRGDDNFSEDTDPGEDLIIEFLDSVGTWTHIASYPGGGTNGEIITDNIPLPFSALHANFQLRVRQTGGSGVGWDYWHIDDVILTETAASRPPLALGSCEDFEQGLSNWSITSTGGNAGINIATFQSSSSSMFTNGGSVTVTSNVIDTNTVQFSGVSMWIRRGSDAFSEDPDGGENLVVEYLNNALNWVVLETFSGSGGQGQVFVPNYNLPASAQHSTFQVRFRQTSGNTGIFDFWHIDDVCIEGTVPFPVFVLQKSVTLEDDPVNLSNPKAIPLSNSIYRIRVVNTGFGSADNNTILISDGISNGIELFTGNYSGGAPFSFTDGSGADISGVNCNFISLANTSDCVTFLDASSNPIIPNGAYDAAVKAIEFRPSGIMNASTGANTPYFDLAFRVRVSGP
jgi:hypothetical protein